MKLIVIIPAYNEEMTIGHVIKLVPKNIERVDKIDVLVVDDGSTDRTAEIAKNNGAFVSVGLGISKQTVNNFMKASEYIYKVESLRKGLEFLIPDYNDLIEQSKNINKDSSIERLDKFVGDAGALGARVTWLIVSLDLKVMEEFSEDIIKSTKFIDYKQVAKICGSKRCAEILEEGINRKFVSFVDFIFQLDRIASNFSAEVGKELAPIILEVKSNLKAKYHNEIKPKLTEITNNILKNIEDGINNAKK